MRIYTIGHSTLRIGAFIKILGSYGIKALIDVRTIPRSRHNPQFGQIILAARSKKHAIEYYHLPRLGGLRHASKDSINTAWRNASFRGYADYMQTDGFLAGIKELLQIARKGRSVIMCAEALPWRCHRSLIADALVIRGVDVEHIFNEKNARKHSITPWAKKRGLRLTYPETKP